MQAFTATPNTSGPISHAQSAIESHLVRQPLSYPPDAGAGSGGFSSSTAQSNAGTGGQQSGAQGSGQGQQGQGQGQSQAIRLSDDAMVDFGDGKAVRYGDYKSGFVSRTEYETQFNKGRDFLLGEAAKLERALKAQYGQQTGQQRQGQQSQQDPDAFLTDIAAMPVVDGKTVAGLVRQLRQANLTPIANLVSTMSAKVQAMEKQLGQLGQQHGTIQEERSTQHLEDFITKGIGEVGEIKALGAALDPKSDVVREIARDLYYSHDTNDPALRTQFTKMLRERMEGLFTLVRASDKKRKDDAIANRGKFPSFNRGAATPNGQTPYKFQRPDELAASLFGEPTQNA